MLCAYLIAKGLYVVNTANGHWKLSFAGDARGAHSLSVYIERAIRFIKVAIALNVTYFLLLRCLVAIPLKRLLLYPLVIISFLLLALFIPPAVFDYLSVYVVMLFCICLITFFITRYSVFEK